VVYPLIFVWARRREEMVTYGPEEREREESGLSTDFLLTLPKKRKGLGFKHYLKLELRSTMDQEEKSLDNIIQLISLRNLWYYGGW
jgi:hypothetical protein